jgi:hypothetical protein
MQRTSALLFLLVFCSATAVQAQAPKPDPEVKKLHVLVGHWAYEAETPSGPWGQGGKSTGERTCQMILGGFFLECWYMQKTPVGEFRALEIMGYDPVNKNFPSEAYRDDGARESEVQTNTGNTWTAAGRFSMAGKKYQYKGTFVLAPDLSSATHKEELSVDGKTWIPSGESRWTKVPPAAKK